MDTDTHMHNNFLRNLFCLKSYDFYCQRNSTLLYLRDGFPHPTSCAHNYNMSLSMAKGTIWLV